MSDSTLNSKTKQQLIDEVEALRERVAKLETAAEFERFFRGSTARASGVAGTGLGLAIAKEIIERHSGRIEIESSGVVGEGTCFTVRLPAQSGPVEIPAY